MVPFNKPYSTSREIDFIRQAIDAHSLSGEKDFCLRAAQWLEEYLDVHKIILTPSCTAALEMAVNLLDLGPGDEVIVPSFTFSSTATAVVLAHATPVFVDCGQDMNISVTAIEQAITQKTKAIIVMHYGGFGCAMEQIKEIAKSNGIYVIEDAAQCLFASYDNKKLGTFGDFGCYSFHETKNIVCGEGGAIAVNNPDFLVRAEILRDKGTNRAQFFRGQTDKYTWHDKGSSYLMSNLQAAYLYAQLLEGKRITARRVEIWNAYYDGLSDLCKEYGLSLLPKSNRASHNGHLFAIFTRSADEAADLISHLNQNGVGATFHYIPLHSSAAGLKYGRTAGDMTVTNDLPARLVRLPLHMYVDNNDIEKICLCIKLYYEKSAKNTSVTNRASI